MKPSKSIAAIALFVCLASACAPGLDGARQALTNAERVQAAAIKAVEFYDQQTQERIIAEMQRTGDVEKAKHDLETYRAKRALVVKALTEAAAVTGLGPALFSLVERGLKKDTDVNAWLQDLFAALLSVKSALSTFGITLGGV